MALTTVLRTNVLHCEGEGRGREGKGRELIAPLLKS